MISLKAVSSSKNRPCYDAVTNKCQFPVTYFLLTLHVQGKFMGASLPQTGSRLMKALLFFDCYYLEHIVFLIRETPQEFHIDLAWKWHTSFPSIVHWPALVIWLPNCKRAGKCGKAAECLGDSVVSAILHQILWAQWWWWQCPLGDYRVQQEMVVSSKI